MIAKVEACVQPGAPTEVILESLTNSTDLKNMTKKDCYIVIGEVTTLSINNLMKKINYPCTLELYEK